MKSVLSILLLLSIFYSCEIYAKPRVTVSAILKDAAMMSINGRQQMIKLNDRSREGYKLIELLDDGVVLLVDGKPEKFRLGVAISSSKAPKASNEVSIMRDDRGMYRTPGSINGVPMNFLVDTGATFVAINSKMAALANIDYQRYGQRSLANTASGTVIAYRVKLNEISVGGISLNLIDAVVVEGNYPRVPLLGMSFLSKVRMRDEGELLTLELR